MLSLKKHELKGHDVFEFMQGELDEHWLESSIYITEEVFAQTELIDVFTDTLVNFNYYGPTEVNEAEWENIKQIVLTSKSSKEKASKQLLAEIDEWANECFKKYSCFTICGM
ncbi:hypothetical protein [Paenibacillus pabuli]|uniref:hypothetical protein n=1 Tax=Paenibacillus pabuli TaxID=1472 RepID=UPI0007851C24|nr:hypothetical protein [Paenibacillus pabuli]MEC0124578.1 hypothetical protein [Paenibacillus pabuli]